MSQMLRLAMVDSISVSPYRLVSLGAGDLDGSVGSDAAVREARRGIA